MAKNRNKDSTRYYSNIHEESVSKALGGHRVSNSGAGHFNKGDVNIGDLMLVECKTSVSEKESFSIKKEWVDTLREECKATRIPFGALSIRFSPEGENLYVINESLMEYLVYKLKVDYKE